MDGIEGLMVLICRFNKRSTPLVKVFSRSTFTKDLFYFRNKFYVFSKVYS